MRLKKLLLAGFKSFVEPTTITLPGDLVGIVGPNGCGKSNVIDAVRWVMGATSARNLRGDSMLDVIFNGTDANDFVAIKRGATEGELRIYERSGGTFHNYVKIMAI